MGTRRRGLEGRAWSWSSGRERGTQDRRRSLSAVAAKSRHSPATPHCASAGRGSARAAGGGGAAAGGAEPLQERAEPRRRAQSPEAPLRSRRPAPLAGGPMGLQDPPLTTRFPLPGDAPPPSRNPPGCWRIQGPARVWGPAARSHEANAEDGPVTGQGLGAAQRAEAQLLVRPRSQAVPAARTPALGHPHRAPPSWDGDLCPHPLPGMRPSFAPHLLPGLGPPSYGHLRPGLGLHSAPHPGTAALGWGLPRISDLGWGPPCTAPPP